MANASMTVVYLLVGRIVAGSTVAGWSYEASNEPIV
jgi:hypothetical protein